MRSKTMFLILGAVLVVALAAPFIDALADDGATDDGESKYVRLRGSVEIHTRDCVKVKRADPGGIVDADLNDGPPCFYCLRHKIK
jgi:hypothetical protein